MRRALEACLLGLLATLPARAWARASPLPPAPPPPPLTLRVVGSAALEDVQVRVSCDETDGEERSAICTVSARFELRAIEPIRCSLSGPLEGGRRPAGDRLTVDGAPPPAEGLSLAPGGTAHVELGTIRVLRASLEYDEGFIISPMRMRHLLLGDSRWVLREHARARARWALIEGEAVAIRGPVLVDARQTELVGVEVGGAEALGRVELRATAPIVALQLEAPARPDTLLQNGGPVLAIGGVTALATGAEEFRLSLLGAYELALLESIFASVSFETDLESIMESVVIEVASPFLILLPSASAGVGFVARQLGPRDADAAFRVRVGVGVWVVGVSADLDYWPAIGEWTASLRARVSL